MKRLAIIGASGHGKVAAEIALASEQWHHVDFFDDAFPDKTRLESWEIKGDSDTLIKTKSDYQAIFIAIGDNAIRLQKFNELSALGCQLTSLIHPSASISRSAVIGIGSIVMPGAVVNSFAKIGDVCIINSNAVVEHDCILGDSVHICPGTSLAGGVDIGHRTMVGIGSSVIQGVSIPANSTIGAGSVVTNNLIDEGTYVGVPVVKK